LSASRVHDNVAKSLQAVQDIVRQFDVVREVRMFAELLCFDWFCSPPSSLRPAAAMAAAVPSPLRLRVCFWTRAILVG
jgi:hypothetical protein